MLQKSIFLAMISSNNITNLELLRVYATASKHLIQDLSRVYKTPGSCACRRSLTLSTKFKGSVRAYRGSIYYVLNAYLLYIEWTWRYEWFYVKIVSKN